MSKFTKIPSEIRNFLSTKRRTCLFNLRIFPLWLQNGKYSGKRYIFASSIKIGKSIDRNRSFGDFVFSCDSETTFDANSDVEISAGTEIRNYSAIALPLNPRLKYTAKRSI